MKDINKTSQPNCYCGQSGDPNMNMLYCVKCGRWLHEECVKCLDVPMLLGDRFYILICSVCNAGSECLARIELTWSDITHLVLYNLSVVQKKKYFDLDKLIMPFISVNWEKLRPFGPVTSVKPEDRRSNILDALKNENRFKSGREIKKSKNIFGLRERVPPVAPSVQPSAAKLKNDVVVWEFQVKERPYQILTAKKPKGRNGKPKKLLTTQKQSKIEEVSKCRGGLPYNENGVHKTKNKSKSPTASAFCEKSAHSGLLDSLIPIPPNFLKENNPFRKSYKSNTTAAKRMNCVPPKDQPLVKKRRFNGRLVDVEPTQNGNHRLLNVKPTAAEPALHDNETHFDAKDYISHNLQTAKKDGFCIIGKRVSGAGSVQYLFQRNRTKVENAVKEKEPLFTITYCCNCCECKLLNKLVF